MNQSLDAIIYAVRRRSPRPQRISWSEPFPLIQTPGKNPDPAKQKKKNKMFLNVFSTKPSLAIFLVYASFCWVGVLFLCLIDSAKADEARPAQQIA